MIRKIINEIKTKLVKNASDLTAEQRSRMYKILNSDNPNFIGYGNKHSEIEKLVREIHKKYQLSYEGACEIFKELVKSDVHDEKISGLFLLNRFKRNFNGETISIFFNAISKYCTTWAFCDTSCIRVIGPFLANNDNLAREVIEIWSNSKDMWIRRASMVILLKIIMVKKDFKNTYVFDMVEKMMKYSEDSEEYIQKGIGWLLKTCSNYKPDIIFTYLMKNKRIFSRLILRYASEKLPKQKRVEILNKN